MIKLDVWYIMEGNVEISKRCNEYIQYFINYSIFKIQSFYDGEMEFVGLKI